MCTGICSISPYRKKRFYNFRSVTLLNCVGFELMNNYIVPSFGDNLNTFIPKPHIKLLRVSHTLSQLIFRSSEF